MSSAAESSTQTEMVTTFEVPNQLPPISMPSYTNSQIEEYLKNMEEANGEVHQIWKTFTERWESSDRPEHDNDFIDWLSKRADKLINLREVLLLKTMSSFESYQQAICLDSASDKTQIPDIPSDEAEDAVDKFEKDFSAVTFVNKIIYCIARAHNLKEEEAVKRYKESLKKHDDFTTVQDSTTAQDSRPVDNANFE